MTSFFTNIKQQITRKCGFTLVELLIVIAIIGILTAITSGQFVNAQKKARDAQRKADLGSVQRALEMYFADNNQFPEADAIVWGTDFSTDETAYMKLLPEDPSGTDYCYAVSGDGMSYGLFSVLENCPEGVSYSPLACVKEDWCWAVTSPNAVPEEF